MRQFFNISIFVTDCKLNGPNIHGPGVRVYLGHSICPFVTKIEILKNWRISLYPILKKKQKKTFVCSRCFAWIKEKPVLQCFSKHFE